MKRAGVRDELYVDLMRGDHRVPIRDRLLELLKDNNSDVELAVATALWDAIKQRRKSTTFRTRIKGDPVFALVELYRAGYKMGYRTAEQARAPVATHLDVAKVVQAVRAMITNDLQGPIMSRFSYVDAELRKTKRRLRRLDAMLVEGKDN